MNINLDINDIVSDEELKEAVLDGIRQSVVRTYSGNEENMKRLFSNLAYEFVFKMVDEQFDGKLEELLRAKIKEAIGELSCFSVFRKKDAWQTEESVAYKILQEESAKSRPLIVGRIEQIINEYRFDDIKDNIGDVVHDCIMEKLFTKN